MRLAVVVSTRGTCERASVGAVISREGRIISTGYVGAPAGLPHCISVGCQIGTHGGCDRTVHAEANAIAFAARFGTSTDGSELHCTHAPCLPCAKLIVNSGIRRVHYETAYRDASGLSLLREAKVVVVQLPVPEESIVVTDPRDEGWIPLKTRCIYTPCIKEAHPLNEKHSSSNGHEWFNPAPRSPMETASGGYWNPRTGEHG
jgi:dCMP deaminase